MRVDSIEYQDIFNPKKEKEGFKAFAEFWFMKIVQVRKDSMTSSAQGHQSVTLSPSRLNEVEKKLISPDGPGWLT